MNEDMSNLLASEEDDFTLKTRRRRGRRIQGWVEVDERKKKRSHRG